MITVNISSSVPVDSTMTRFLVEGTLTFSGSYVANGDTMSFAGFDQIKSNSVPTRVEVYEQPPTTVVPGGYIFVFSPGTTQANGLLVIFTAQGTQISSTYASNTALAATTVAFRAEFLSFI